MYALGFEPQCVGPPTGTDSQLGDLGVGPVINIA
jgi:hypothetical protein